MNHIDPREWQTAEKKRLRALGMSKTVSADVMSGKITEAEGLVVKKRTALIHAPDPNSKRQARLNALRQARKRGGDDQAQKDEMVFETQVGEFPDDPVSLEAWKWMLDEGGHTVRVRAVLKAAEIESIETSAEVMAAAKVIVQGWKKRGWVP